MGLDLYAGTLTRYYARNWKSTVQQWAEANGYTFNRMGSDGPMEQEQKPDPAEVQAAMEGWQDSLLAALKAGGTQCPPWPENNEAPYYTDKPDWDAYHALLLAAACKTAGQEVPATVDKGLGEGFWERPVVKEAAESWKGALFAGAELWLPFPESFYFRCPNPLGNEVVIGTTAWLEKDLARINDLLWQAGEEEILGWQYTEGYPADAQISPDGKLCRVAENARYDTLSLAKLAYSLFWQAARFSRENQAPIVLDY